MSQSALHVLLVEDDPWAAAAFKKALAAVEASAGFEVVLTPDAALARMDDADIVFLSLDLPGCGALRLLKRLSPGEERPPVIALSSDRSDPRVAAAVDAGAAETLQRGFRPGQLAGILTTIARYWRVLPSS